jgi:hypothetical protein
MLPTGRDAEIEYSANLVGRVLFLLMSRHEAIFPRRKEPWYWATDEDAPK